MLQTTTTLDDNEQNKENFDDLKFLSRKPIDDDAESSHSDCMIIESDIPSSSTLNDSNFNSSFMGILPNSLSKQTNLLFIYENQTMNVRVLVSVDNLEEEQRITISHLNSLYSIPKRHLYLAIPCDIQHVSIPQQSRIMYITSSTKKHSLGFICEIPSMYNHLRHLILFDDGTAAYTMINDYVHLCLGQDFEQNRRSIESKLIQQNFEELVVNNDKRNRNGKRFQINNYVRVRKFDGRYHNAQIIDIDCSIIKLKFYERQAQTEIWMHRRSLLIDDVVMSPIEVASPIFLRKKRKHDEISPISRPSSPLYTDPLPYKSHQCSPHCVLTIEENLNLNCITQNPYTLPFSYGWKYYHIGRYAKDGFTRKPKTHKGAKSRSNYLYRSPCGRSLLTLDEIEDYLFQTDSKLTIKLFIDDCSTRLESSVEYDSQYTLDDDICHGKEYVKIPVYNEINSNLPDSFIYGTETRSNLTFINDTTTSTCCSCTDNCRNRLKCPCWLKTFEQAKLNENEQIANFKRRKMSEEYIVSRFGYVHQRLKVPIWSGIYECNSKCSCHTKQCTNRLVQNNLYQQLQLFYTDTKGWALRALHDIPRGSFINAYVGELITEEMATKRDYKYLAILDHKSHLLLTNDNNKKRKQPLKTGPNNVRVLNETTRVPVKRCVRLSTNDHTDDEDEEENDSCFILDAKHYGSISRFYNHSCKPNVNIQNVFINTHDPRFPVIALFACRNIRAGEEICWDYSYTVGCMPDVRIDCQCQSSNCRGRLL